MRAPPLYYRSCVSDGVWLFVAARAPHRMTRIRPVVPKKRRCLGLLVVGLGAVLCELNFLVDYKCDIWPFISIVNVWLPIEWCGIDGVYK